jgi:hypothetical protein
MKKIFLILAFTGIVVAASAHTFGDDKKGDKKGDKKESCEKSCSKGEGKSCCHAAKAEGKADNVKATEGKAATTPAKK